MEEKQILERIERLNQQQTTYAKWQCIFSAVAAVCCIAAVIALLWFLPRLSAVLGQVELTLAEVQVVAEQLAQADLAGLTQQIGGLVTSSQTGLEAALEKISAIDIDTLNQAIEDLAAVIQPLRRLINTFT